MNSYPRYPSAHDLHDAELPIVSSHTPGVGSRWAHL